MLKMQVLTTLRSNSITATTFGYYTKTISIPASN